MDAIRPDVCRAATGTPDTKSWGGLGEEVAGGSTGDGHIGGATGGRVGCEGGGEAGGGVGGARGGGARGTGTARKADNFWRASGAISPSVWSPRTLVQGRKDSGVVQRQNSKGASIHLRLRKDDEFVTNEKTAPPSSPNAQPTQQSFHSLIDHDAAVHSEARRSSSPTFSNRVCLMQSM